MKCSHKTTVGGLPPEALAQAVASLRYDALRDFFQHLTVALKQDGFADFARGNPHLSRLLLRLSRETEECWEAAVCIDEVCCKHYTPVAAEEKAELNAPRIS